MKTIFIAATLLAIANFTYAQTEIEQPVVNPPDAVTMALKRSYPEARAVNWDRVCIKNDYMATVKVGEMETTLTYDENGTLKSTEMPVAIKDVPQAAVDYMKRNHPTVDKYKHISKITDNTTGTVAYELSAAGKIYVFDKNGTYVRVENE